MEQVAEHRPQELRLRVFAGAKRGEPLCRILLLEQAGDLFGDPGVGRAVVAGIQVQHLDLLARLAVDPGAGLLAERALVDQLRQPRRCLEVAVPGVVGQGVGHGPDDVGHRVQADHVGGAVGRGLRTADRGAGQGVHGVEAQAGGSGVVHRRQHREHADAVSDEVGRVAGNDHALAEPGGEEGLERVHHRRIGALGRDQFGQVHVAGRVEEMHAAEPRSQGFRKNIGQCIDSQAGRVAGQDRVRGQVRRDLAVQVLLPVHPFGDRLDHEVASAQQRQVIVVVGRHDPRRQRPVRERGGAEPAEVGDRAGDDAVLGAVLRGQVEQDGVDPGVHQVGCDLGAHDAGAENRGAPYKQILRHVLQPLEDNQSIGARRPAVANRISSRAARSRCTASGTLAGRLIRPKSAIA
jgi:hypothetical protein